MGLCDWGGRKEGSDPHELALPCPASLWWGVSALQRHRGPLLGSPSALASFSPWGRGSALAQKGSIISKGKSVRLA